jgi:hypothetical protein
MTPRKPIKPLGGNIAPGTRIDGWPTPPYWPRPASDWRVRLRRHGHPRRINPRQMPQRYGRSWTSCDLRWPIWSFAVRVRPLVRFRDEMTLTEWRHWLNRLGAARSRGMMPGRPEWFEIRAE